MKEPQTVHSHREPESAGVRWILQHVAPQKEEGGMSAPSLFPGQGLWPGFSQSRRWGKRAHRLPLFEGERLGPAGFDPWLYLLGLVFGDSVSLCKEMLIDCLKTQSDPRKTQHCTTAPSHQMLIPGNLHTPHFVWIKTSVCSTGWAPGLTWKCERARKATLVEVKALFCTAGQVESCLLQPQPSAAPLAVGTPRAWGRDECSPETAGPRGLWKTCLLS